MNVKHTALFTALLCVVTSSYSLADPEIEVTWSEEIGWPDVIDWNLAYEDLFTGRPYPIPVTVRNIGDADLVVEDHCCPK